MPDTASYLAIAAGPDVAAEIEVKRSRFLAVLRRVDDEAGARQLLAELRKQHHAARHHCSAFVIGPQRRLQRSNDDGEPAGTAGMPMLQTLLGVDAPSGDRPAADHDDASRSGPPSDVAAPGPLSDVAAVVVRWFGGTLLGAGGLTRAYAAAVGAAVAEARFVVREHRPLRTLELPHEIAGRIEHDLRTIAAVVRATDYVVDGVRTTVALPGGPDGAARFGRWLAERQLTAEDAGAEWVDRPWQ